MKVLLLNGSANKNGSTSIALGEISKTLNQEGIETEIITTDAKPIRDCCGCKACKTNNTGRCIFGKDIVNEIIDKAKECDGFIFGTPVYYAHPSGRILSILDRVFYAGGKNFAYKPASAVAIARRSGTTATLDVLNKYFTINNMPVVSSTYWNNAFGAVADDVKQDEEGLLIMRTVAKNMAWLLKCIESGKENGISIPQSEKRVFTNFIK